MDKAIKIHFNRQGKGKGITVKKERTMAKISTIIAVLVCFSIVGVGLTVRYRKHYAPQPEKAVTEIKSFVQKCVETSYRDELDKVRQCGKDPNTVDRKELIKEVEKSVNKKLREKGISEVKIEVQ